MTPPSLLDEWARLLVGSLVQAGVRDAVVSPGSRSTPLAWAAHRHPELTVHSVFDERSAAFFALGQGRATGRPSLLICTSGTAAANYYPAIVEASLAFVPLIALTADRPFEAQHAGAAQTIDQLKLYGDYCRAFFELGLPDSHPSALSGIKRIAAQAVARALSPEPGPVHLNARARKPLEPAAGETAADRELAESVSRLLAQGTTVSAPATREPNAQAIRVLADACRRAERGLVVCGPLGPDEAGSAEALVELHEKTRFPILAEAASQYRFQGGALAAARADGFGFLLRTPRFVEHSAPDLLICVGATPTSSGVERLIVDQPGLERHVIAPYGWPDPHGNARSVTVAGIEATLRALCTELSSGVLPERAGAWHSTIRRASELAEASVRLALQGEALSEGNATAAVVEALPDGAILVIGNSLPIRNVDSYAGTRGGLTVLCQRGANGIDGLVAGAAGAARAFGRPTLLLLGDVSLLHDLNSLALAQKLETPFVVAVLDNAGGRIFEQLPVARLFETDPDAAKLWLTPHGLDFEHAARLFALGYAAPRRPSEARAAVERALAAPGATLVHLKVPADSAAELDRRILNEIDRSLS